MTALKPKADWDSPVALKWRSMARNNLSSFMMAPTIMMPQWIVKGDIP